MAKFIKARQGRNHWVIYTDDNDDVYCYQGGTWTWRNHNPGNLRIGSPRSIVRSFPFIGLAGGFVVFPDENIGRQAMIALLKTSPYQNKNLLELVRAYAPPEDHNNVAAYLRLLRKQTGIKDERKLREFTEHQFQLLCYGIERMEGYRKGTITKMRRIIGVKESLKGICDFNVEDLGWMSKAECINLTKKGQIDAVLCTSRNGNLYLRSRPDKFANNNFCNMSKK